MDFECGFRYAAAELFPVRSWCPEDPNGLEHLALRQWLQEHFGAIGGLRWEQRLESLVELVQEPNRTGSRKFSEALLLQVAAWDSAPFVELLYPLMPELFLQARGYQNFYKPIASFEANLNAAALFVLMGAAKCLETLLELGADPNGLDGTRSWNSVRLQPVTPLDLALLLDHEDCARLLELYGGERMEDFCGVPEAEWIDPEQGIHI